jgi:hypothetical protein
MEAEGLRLLQMEEEGMILLLYGTERSFRRLLVNTRRGQGMRLLLNGRGGLETTPEWKRVA